MRIAPERAYQVIHMLFCEGIGIRAIETAHTALTGARYWAFWKLLAGNAPC